MGNGGHFTAAIKWNGTLLHYDGMRHVYAQSDEYFCGFKLYTHNWCSVNIHFQKLFLLLNNVHYRILFAVFSYFLYREK
jgi:hypothetical protein